MCEQNKTRLSNRKKDINYRSVSIVCLNEAIHVSSDDPDDDIDTISCLALNMLHHVKVISNSGGY